MEFTSILNPDVFYTNVTEMHCFANRWISTYLDMSSFYFLSETNGHGKLITEAEEIQCGQIN